MGGVFGAEGRVCANALRPKAAQKYKGWEEAEWLRAQSESRGRQYEAEREWGPFTSWVLSHIPRYHSQSKCICSIKIHSVVSGLSKTLHLEIFILFGYKAAILHSDIMYFLFPRNSYGESCKNSTCHHELSLCAFIAFLIIKVIMGLCKAFQKSRIVSPLCFIHFVCSPFIISLQSIVIICFNDLLPLLEHEFPKTKNWFYPHFYPQY